MVVSLVSACGHAYRLAEHAGLAIGRDVMVDAFLETSAPTSSRPGTSRAGPLPQRRKHQGRALGRCRATGPDRSAQHAWAARTLRRRAILPELALRHSDQLCRSCRDISNEALALFVRFWLTATPPLPDTAKPAAQAKGRERYENFVEALGRRLARGQTLAQEISLDIAPAQASPSLSNE